MKCELNPLSKSPNYFMAYSADAIKLGISRVSQEIDGWANFVVQSTGQQPIAMCVLRGGSIFYADLIRALTTSIQMSFCSCWSYSSDKNEVLGVERRFTLERTEVSGRAVLLVDDICDTGSTLDFVAAELLSRGAAEVRTAVLIHRFIPDGKFFPNWAVFEHHGPEWFVGYGMEDCNHYSNLADVYSIKKS